MGRVPSWPCWSGCRLPPPCFQNLLLVITIIAGPQRWRPDTANKSFIRGAEMRDKKRMHQIRLYRQRFNKLQFLSLFETYLFINWPKFSPTECNPEACSFEKDRFFLHDLTPDGKTQTEEWEWELSWAEQKAVGVEQGHWNIKGMATVKKLKSIIIMIPNSIPNNLIRKK